jgi:hypothetical protein
MTLRSIVWLAAALALAGCVNLSEEPVAASHCLADPTLFDWQRLDSRNLVIWPRPSGVPYHITIADDLLGDGRPGHLEFVDGNNDALLCSEGWDSVAVARPAPVGEASETNARDVSAIFFINRVNETGLASLRQAYERTRGERQRG